MSSSLIMAQQKLEHNFALSPVTALAFQDIGESTYLFVGEDAWLKIYHVTTSRLLGKVRAFYSQPIHGIHVSESKAGLANGEAGILVWGGQSITVLPPSSIRDLVRGVAPPEPTEFKAPDWIYDGILFPAGDPKGALVTAHNELIPFSVSPDGHGLTFGTLTSPSRPILYSANLCLLGPDTILVAGGTVFGEIIVWKYHFGSSRPSQWEVLYVFTGHEGSVFGVSISPEFEIAPGINVRLLGSCSDDRTIRIWDVTDRQLTIPAGQEIDSRLLTEARETGFGDNSEAKEENKNDSSRCLAVAMGHLSRIWHVKFGRSSHAQMGPVEVYSFGEDTTRQRWELTFDLKKWQEGLSPTSGPVGNLRNCSVNSCHNGKNIWSVAISTKGDQEPLIATGGADGRVAISGVQGSADSTKYRHLDFTVPLEKVLQQLEDNGEPHNTTVDEPKNKKGVKYAFQKYSFLSDDLLMATATSGRIFLAAVTDSLSWEEVLVSDTVVEDLRSYMVMKTPVKDTVILGGATGKVYLYRRGQEIMELAHFPGKISDIILLQDPSQISVENQQPWSVIITVLGLDHATILNFDPSSMKSTIDTRKIILPEHCIITAAAFLNSILIVGSRIGALTIHTLTRDSSDLVPLSSRRDPKGKDAITAICPLPGSSTSFLAACRDGRYRIYTLNASSVPFLNLQHEISPPLGMIEGAWFSSPSSRSSSPELILHGFKGKNFVVWNESSQQTIASIECGGAHRPFSCVSPPEDPNQLRLAFTKASRMRFYSQPAPFLQTLKEGGHGREIRAIAASSRYIATAAEDTNIRIWESTPSSSSSPSLKCLAIIEKHSAGIQAMKWFGEDYLLTSAGSEEFYIWRISRLDSSYDALAVVCEAVWDDGTRDGDLRIVDFDVRPWTTTAEEEEKILIAMVLSNSEVRTYTYSPETNEFQLLAKGMYTGACPTKARHLIIPDSEEVHVLTGYTDGHLAIWRTAAGAAGGKEAELVHEPIKVHQSSVKALDLVMLSGEATNNNSRWLVATGGDDNALGFLDLSYDPAEKSYTVQGRYRVASAHAAAVTGLCAVAGGGKEGEVEVVTVSNDQRVKLWKGGSAKGEEEFKVKLLANKYSSVADAGDVEKIVDEGEGKKKVMVGGVGMEVWDLIE
ncbi:putative cytosolic iron-sulfur protein assembly protein 1 [Cladorrhinum samala]|uniref:Cytosolic iron-sulfur protein assembly protein 1 n=1 Tax=Cladorrhinum samala TaxID=585594 RepID=A0AAV9HTI6_9PEZI|nr:putative cytosolic iron-sulfur protein assembly protein 1 [Cladorrhinum samala]